MHRAVARNGILLLLMGVMMRPRYGQAVLTDDDRQNCAIVWNGSANRRSG